MKVRQISNCTAGMPDVENNDCYFVKYLFMHERTSEFYLKLNCQVLSSDSAF